MLRRHNFKVCRNINPTLVDAKTEASKPSMPVPSSLPSHRESDLILRPPVGGLEYFTDGAIVYTPYTLRARSTLRYVLLALWFGSRTNPTTPPTWWSLHLSTLKAVARLAQGRFRHTRGYSLRHGRNSCPDNESRETLAIGRWSASVDLQETFG